MKNKKIPLPNQIRKMSRSFSWIDHCILRGGWLERMTIEAFAVYSFLILAADRDGISFYRKEKICDILGLDFIKFHHATNYLLKQELIAFQPFSAHDPNGFYQVLNVPSFSKEILPASTLRTNSSIETVGNIFQKILGENTNGCNEVGRDPQA